MTNAHLRVLVLTQLGVACSASSGPQGDDDNKDGEDDTTSAPLDRDGDGYASPLDCDDTRAWIHPGADEYCNGLDDDCDDEVDEDAIDRVERWADADGDGWGTGAATLGCPDPAGFALDEGDCDDADPQIHPGAEERCNDIDDDCDGDVDHRLWHADADEDGYGADPATVPGSACEDPPDGTLPDGGDCDDFDATVNPEGADVCGGPLDEDCDGHVAHCLWFEWEVGEERCRLAYETERQLDSYTASASPDRRPGGEFALALGLPGPPLMEGTDGCPSVEEDAEVEVSVIGAHIQGRVSGGWRWGLDDSGVWSGESFGLALGPDQYDPGDGSPVYTVQGGLEFDLSNIWIGEIGGRPFTVGPTPRLAAARPDAWAPAAKVLEDAIPAPLQARIAATWARLGRYEHASVASFARFSLELMALGAPAELLTEPAVAMADEVRHARACFGIAAALGAPDAGVGPLDVACALDDLSVEGVLERLIVEGCVGETLSAAEAAAALEAARAPAAREALTEIVADEARHAAYAWRCARWVLEAHPDLRPVAVAAFDRAAPTIASPRADPAGPTLAAWGLLDARARARSTAAAWRSVVLPARDALLGGVPGAWSTAPPVRTLRA